MGSERQATAPDVLTGQARLNADTTQTAFAPCVGCRCGLASEPTAAADRDAELFAQTRVDRKGFNRVFGWLFTLATLLLFGIAALLDASELSDSGAGLAMACLTIAALVGLTLLARRRRRALEQMLDLRIG